MTEVRVIARAVARKGNEDRLKALLQSMLAPTRAESGCKLYELYESGEWGRFYFYELWESQAALKQHAASPHYKHLELTVGDLLEEPFEINILREVLSIDESGSENSFKKTGLSPGRLNRHLFFFVLLACAQFPELSKKGLI